MALLTSLFNMLDRSNVGGIAGALGESEQSVSRGMQSSIAAVLGGLASKAADPGTLRTLLDLAANVPSGATLSQLASGVSDVNSPLISAGKRVLSGLFGTSESAVTSAISRDSGLQSGVTSTLMAVAAPMVIASLTSVYATKG
jgi:OmpA-OmpF porin, OOP family